MSITMKQLLAWRGRMPEAERKVERMYESLLMEAFNA
jgi:hypothetical protein